MLQSMRCARVIVDLSGKRKLACDLGTLAVYNCHPHPRAARFVLRDLGNGIVRLKVLDLLEMRLGALRCC